MYSSDTNRPMYSSNYQEQSRSRQPSGSNTVIVHVLLLIVLAIGAYYRFMGQNWDDYTLLHPDERGLTDVASAINGTTLLPTDPQKAFNQQTQQECLARYPQTGGVGDFFDSKCSTWYPRNVEKGLYVYGELPLFVVRIAAEVTRALHLSQLNGQLDSNAPDYADRLFANEQRVNFWVVFGGIQIVGRSVSAIAELLSWYFVFLIGRRLYNQWVGLLATALGVATVLPIQLSHFWTSDAFTSLPVTITVYFAVRAMDSGKKRDFIGFGIAFGAALASRINLLPLGGVIVLAAIIHGLPALDSLLPSNERNRLVQKLAAGLVLAGLFTLLSFRITMPHAFTGGPGLAGFFNIISNKPESSAALVESATDTLPAKLAKLIFYDPWLEDVGKAQYFVSGDADMPPNHQWVGRMPYGFAWWNMVAYGMGLPLGLFSWGAWLAALIQIIRARPNWTRHAIPVAWVLVYFALMGRLWVMVVRYYIPLYPFLILLAAWGLVTWVSRAWRAMQRSSALRARLGFIGAVLMMIIVVGGTYLYATMFTNMYRRMQSRVYASQWVYRNLPGVLSTTVTLADNSTRLLNLATFASNGTLEVRDNIVDLPVPFTSPVTGEITAFYVPHVLTNPSNAVTSVLSIAVLRASDNVPLATGQLTLTGESKRTSIYGEPVTIPLDKPLVLEKDQRYAYQITLSGGSPVQLTGTVIASEGGWDDPIPWSICVLPLAQPLTPDTPSGLVPYASDECNKVSFWGPIYKGVEMQMAYEDVEQKRAIFKQALDQTDYLIISSNRFYDSLARIPWRFPLSLEYYKALFSEQLGFHLDQLFTAYPYIGNFQIADQYLPTYSAPRWLNEFEADEAFHVYDHPAVLVYKKTEHYSSTQVAHILDSVVLNDTTAAQGMGIESPNLINLIAWRGRNAAVIPSGFMMSDDQAQIQQQGPSWTSLFNPNWLINQSQIAAVVIWWVTIVLFGWAIWPILFAVLPGLSDRGYPLAKIAALLVVSWLVWVGGTFHLLTWSSWGILLTLLTMAVVSLIVVRRQGEQLRTYVVQHWRHFVIVELIGLILFAAFVIVRLGNPDLWHINFGGEKPMDFAYFTAVVRSTIFPPYDPWYAGGYLNYYYYGFVIVGTPVKLLGLNPAVAYNLIVPTLFAMTGLGAFSLAFNIARALAVFGDKTTTAAIRRDAPVHQRLAFALQVPKVNPYLAGIFAILLCLVLGNLHTPQLALTEGVVRRGGCMEVPTIRQWMIDQYTKTHNGELPPFDQPALLEPSLSDQIRFTTQTAGQLWNCTLAGFSSLPNDPFLPIGGNRWFWAARSVVGEQQNNSFEINEFPIFTYIYGDLHAHMIAMPLTLLVLSWLAAEVIAAGRLRRSILSIGAAAALGGLAVGILRPTNSWDWPTYLLLSLLALIFTMWIQRGETMTRHKLVGWVTHLGWFFAVQLLAAWPFMKTFATSYSAIRSYEGLKTTLFSLVDMKGLFLFFIISFFLWQTGRLLRNIYVRDLINKRYVWWILLGTLVAGILLTLGLGLLPIKISLLIGPIPVAFIIIPLLIWCAALFFVPQQSQEMRILYAMIGLALCLNLGVEIIVIEGDMGRQNTFFKFYMQAWILLSIPAALMLAWLLRASLRWAAVLRIPWLLVSTILLSAAAMYPVMAVPAKNQERFSQAVPLTLNGQDYMKYSTYFERYAPTTNLVVTPLSGDLDMIHWLQDNVQGIPPIMEAVSYPSEYVWDGRIAINTGLPTIIGWNNHQKQQRAIDPLPILVEQRNNNVRFAYDTTDIAQTWAILKFYHVKYIISGGLERILYNPLGLQKFDQMMQLGLLRVVYQNAGDRIYEVILDAPFNMQPTAASLP